MRFWGRSSRPDHETTSPSLSQPCRRKGNLSKVVLITGGGRGIGAATAKLAAERGYSVCVNYRTHRDAAESVVRAIEDAGGSAVTVQADVGVEADVVRLFREVDARIGRLSALVNNAGIVEHQTRVEQMDSARLWRVFGTNVIGAFLCSREAVCRMSTARGGVGGAIVNVSSRAAQLGSPGEAAQLGSPGEYVDYAASKAALEALTVGLAHEVAAEGIRVNGVRAGIISTDIHASGGEPGRADRLGPRMPMQRAGEPIEVARAILWLLSDEASYSTASFVDVAGGR